MLCVVCCVLCVVYVLRMCCVCVVYVYVLCIFVYIVYVLCMCKINVSRDFCTLCVLRTSFVVYLRVLVFAGVWHCV